MATYTFAIQPWKSHESPASNVSFSFHVPNLEEYCQSLDGKIKLSVEPTPHPFGGVTAEIHDPDGNHIFLTRWQSDEEYKKTSLRSKGQTELTIPHSCGLRQVTDPETRLFNADLDDVFIASVSTPSIGDI